MNPNQQLHDLGQSLWLDNITRTPLDDGTPRRYVKEPAVTGLTSNPSIFEKAIVDSDAYDTAIARSSTNDTEALFFELPLSALTRADLAAIEESTFAGVPVNVTLLFSAGQTLAAVQAWARDIERRIKAGRNPPATSVSPLFVSRWDLAVRDKITDDLRDLLGIAVAQRTYRDYLAPCQTPRWQALTGRTRSHTTVRPVRPGQRGDVLINDNIAVLIRRSAELSVALSRRSLTREKVRWSARIALAGIPENSLPLPRWWELRAHIRRLARLTWAGLSVPITHSPRQTH
jgi:hypothetical protein